MKRIMFFLSFLLFSLFLDINIVSAKSTASTVNDLYIRTSPDSTSSFKDLIPKGKIVTLIKNTNQSGKGCNDNWFEVSYNNYKGYVCSSYLTNVIWESTSNPDDTEDKLDIETLYKQELEKFPDSYKSKLEALHKIYPNAIFKAKNLDLSFNSFANYQYQGYNKNSINNCPYGLNKGVSLLEDTNGSRDGLKSLDSWAYETLYDKFNTSYYGGQEGRWYAPSLNTVRHYLDPRNFLNNKEIFMFEDLSYAGEYYLESNIEKMLSSSFMANKNVTGKENTTFAKTFIEAGKKHNINPYALVSRVMQEVGKVRTVMVSGTWTEYNKEYYGYYNFYNIKAAGNSVNETIKNGLSYAKSQGWDNEYDAIIGGAYFIAKDYISVGQNTTYFQKFDIYGPCYGLHQYMQNIEAPLNEAVKVYNSYNSSGLLNSNFVFVIPVYNSMPATTNLDNPKNSNNYLRNLTVNGATVEGFDYKKLEYKINVSPLINSLEIAAIKASSKSKISGTGTFNLTSTSQTKNIIVTAENGIQRTYKVTVTRDESIPISISEILNTMLINSDGTYISSIKLNTKANDFIASAKKVDKNVSVVIKDTSGKVKTDSILATGDKITITSGKETKTFTVVIYGDINGDGIINSADLLKLRQHLIGIINLKDSYEMSANITKNDTLINSADLLKLRQHLIGTITIEQ